MKALTVRQPWADAIAHGPKRTENRTRSTTYRGLLLIHAGLTGDRAAVLAGIPVGPDKRGHVIGTAQLVGCHQATDGCCPEWGLPNCWHWELTDVQPLTQPVPAKGQLGLWNPPAEVLAAVRDQPCPECTGDQDCHQLGCQQPRRDEPVGRPTSQLRAHVGVTKPARSCGQFDRIRVKPLPPGAQRAHTPGEQRQVPAQLESHQPRDPVRARGWPMRMPRRVRPRHPRRTLPECPPWQGVRHWL